MKKILYIAFAATVAVGAGTLSSCSDFLEAENKTNINSDDYFPNGGMEGLRVYTYSLLKPIVSSPDIYEWGTDLYVATRGGDPGELHRYTLTPQTSDVTDLYTQCRNLIQNANCMLYYANEEEDGQAIAEAKFLRCYGYYIMLQHWGAVPYVTEYIRDANRNYPKSPISEIYPALISELEGIMNDSNLPTESTGDELGYVSQRAVKALLAKVCLAAGWDLGTTLNDAAAGTYSINDTQYFTKAAQYADAAIEGQALSMSFEDKWAPANETNNPEIIFSVQYEREGNPGTLSESGHGLQNTFGSYYGVCTTNGTKYCNSGKALSTKAIYLWGPGDDRFNATFMNTIYNYTTGFWGTTGYYAYYNADPDDLAQMGIAYRYFPYYTTEAEAEAEFAANKDRYALGGNVNSVFAYILGDPVTQYTFSADGSWTKSSLSYQQSCVNVNGTTVCKKWDDPATAQENTNSSNGYRDIVVFHLSDMYLTAAEAYLMAGNTGQALTYVNAVRTRANAGTLASFADYQPEYSVPANFGAITDLDVILDEKAREEFGEMQRWMDLRRTRQLVRYNVAFNTYISSASDMSNARGEIKWYRPIPEEEMSNNTGLTAEDQNPGY